ncbi:MAG: efflux transporter outer membrane subunit [Pseudomonadota bacterium]
MKSFRALPVTLLAAVLAGCASHIPKDSEPALRDSAPVSVDAAGQRGALPTGEWPAADWWRRYDDPVLDQLIRTALAHSPSLATADARFAAARQSVRVTGAATGVQVTANATFERQRLSDNGLFPPEFLGFNWYNQADLGLAATYTFDWWGKQRAGIAAAIDEARAAQAERSAAALLLSTSIAESYFGWQADQRRLQLAREQLSLVERQASVTARRITAEIESGDNARPVAQRSAQSREQIAMLEGSARLRVVTLAALLAQPADQLPALEVRELPAPPATLPGSLRMDLLARRPDIIASRWRVEAARSNIKAARADYYPDVSIRALAGLSSIEIGNLLEAGSAVPLVSAAVHLPLFDSGLRNARYGASQSRLASAIADYDETVVNAARETGAAAATSLQLAAQRVERERQLAESTAYEVAAAARVRAGTSDIRPQLSAQIASLNERDALAQLQAAALVADITLQRALGGGYLFTEETP